MATPYKFDASGKISGGLLEGLDLVLDPLRKAALDAYKADPAGVLYGQPYADPYAKGGQLDGLKFGADGKLYGSLGGNLAEISGWQFDTSTLPTPAPGAFYDANILPDEGGNLIEVLDRGAPIGYARQRMQFAIEADSNKPGLGSKRTQTLGDSRVSTPGQVR